MRVVENHCVYCGLPCLGNSCPLIKVPMYYCDICKDKIAEYQTDEYDYCALCFKKYLQEIFDDMTLTEKSDVLNVNYINI